MKKTLMSFVSIGLSILLSGSLSAQTDIKKVSVKENQTISNYAQAYNKTNQQHLDFSSKIKDGATLRIPNNLFKKKSPDQKVRTLAVSSDGKFALKLQAVRKEAGLEGAKIIVMADDVWGDGTGYQMLIDANATAYGDIIPITGPLSEGDTPKEIYDQFEYKLPANADGARNTENILSGETDSVVVPTGVYDFCFTNPTPGQKVWIAAGDYSRVDDFVFAQGTVYVFKIQYNEATEGDDVSIVFRCDLALTKILSPLSGCGLTDSEKVKVVVVNNAGEDVTGFDISYSINGSEFITQRINGSITSGEKMEYVFDQGVDMSEEGQSYEIKAVVTVAGDENRSNDTLKGKVMNFAPVSPPVNWDFSKKDQAANCTFDANAWAHDTILGYVATDTSVLASRCISMDPGKYRVRYDYLAGMFFFIFEFKDDFDIVYKKAGATEWILLKSFKEVYTKDMFETSEVTVDIKEKGEYSFAIMPKNLNRLFIRGMSVNTISAHDIRITDVVSSLAPTTPLSQIAKPVITATVENRGLNAEEGVKIKASIPSQKAISGESTPVGLAIEEIKDLTMLANITGVKAGDSLEFVVEASMTNIDDFKEDNKVEVSVMISDSVFAWENMTEFPSEDGLGSNSAAVSMGYVFELSELDTVTSVTIGWVPLKEEGATAPVGIYLYKFNKEEQTIGELYYSKEFKRDSKGGLATYMISSRELSKGAYFIELKQTTNTFMAVCVDREMGGYFWMPDASTGKCTKVSDFGNVAIRVNLGHNANISGKDAMVASIPKPLSKGIFSANEKIIAEIFNNGKLPIKDMPVVLLVNKTVQTKTIASIPAYGRVNIEFEADLSTPGEYLIYVYTNLEGDENRINDTLNKIVTSKEPSSPYTMDFEECEDFQTSGFNPNWKSVDVDGAPTYGFNGASFPGMGDALGFMVFNPSSTTPPMKAAEPQNGERYGVSISSETAVNSDWLISPKLQLKQESKLEFYVKTFHDQYGPEIYNVLISTTNDNIDSFKPLLSKMEAPIKNWEKKSVDLKDYDGKDVYIAIQCVSKDVFIFMVDNIKVITGVSNEKNNSNLDIRVFPNPATDIIQFSSVGVEIDNIVIYDMLGSKIYESAKKLGLNNFRYNVQNLNTGVYFARISTSQGTELVKFIVR